MVPGTMKSDGWKIVTGVGGWILFASLIVSNAIGNKLRADQVRTDSFSLEVAALQRIDEDIAFLSVRLDGHFKNAEFHMAQADQMKALCKVGLECDPEEIQEELRRANAERGLQTKLSAGLNEVAADAADAAIADYGK